MVFTANLCAPVSNILLIFNVNNWTSTTNDEFPRAFCCWDIGFKFAEEFSINTKMMSLYTRPRIPRIIREYIYRAHVHLYFNLYLNLRFSLRVFRCTVRWISGTMRARIIPNDNRRYILMHTFLFQWLRSAEKASLQLL